MITVSLRTEKYFPRKSFERNICVPSDFVYLLAKFQGHAYNFSHLRFGNRFPSKIPNLLGFQHPPPPPPQPGFCEWARGVCQYKVESLSSDVFERRTSTGSGLFPHLSCDFEQTFGQVVSIRVKTLSNTNLVASRHIKKETSKIRFTYVTQNCCRLSSLISPDQRVDI